MSNNILFYVHYNKFNKLSDHVIFQLTAMRPIYQEIYLISNSKLEAFDLKKLSEKGLYDQFLQRENSGYDFSAWSEGIEKYGYDKLATFDNLTIMNDTCFGPFWDFESTFDAFSGKKNRLTSGVLLTIVLTQLNPKIVIQFVCQTIFNLIL